MALIGLVSAKGSPGVSTVAAELMVRWPREVVGLELDPSGGSWALRHGWSWDPGLVSLAASDTALTIDTALEHGQRVAANAAAICSSPFGDQVRAATELLMPRLIGCPDELDVIIDVGRLDPLSLPLLARCTTVLVVSRTRTEDIGQLQRLSEVFTSSRVAAQLLLIGHEHHPHEISDVVGLPLLDVSIPFGSRRNTLNRAYNVLVDTVAHRVAHRAIPMALVDAFGALQTATS